ncbi:MAG TPA: 16S rRNA (adenine(1518)-N(6)/adenine(1519)-N(6))-dimethyltransferase RsmA, partial [Syntrophales bacterium]|nr:16S rRNA (adenine(1518)-N(6)/adenine(1519)-N(6))-dimethyltransferase RsmA [Syntrophales bacterium]
NVIEKVVRTAGVKPGDTVVEIGAGLGVMTAMVARKAGKVIALEVDRKVAAVLKEELRDVENVEAVEADVLLFDFPSLSPRLKVIGNIPYNISTPILFRLLEFRNRIDSITVMLQKEVGDRIAASPGSKAYGILSVVLSMYFEVSREFTVSADCFYPRPKVDSVVLRMVVRENPVFPLASDDFFRRLVKTALGQRRKTLMNTLRRSPLFRPSSEGDILRILQDLGIEGRRRGETLTVEEFGRLSNALLPLTISLTD